MKLQLTGYMVVAQKPDEENEYFLTNTLASTSFESKEKVKSSHKDFIIRIAYVRVKEITG